MWKEPIGVVGVDRPVELPDRDHPQQARADPGHGQHLRAQAGARHAVERHPHRPPDRRADRHPARRRQHRHVERPPRRRGALHLARRRHGRLHRVDGHRQADHGGGRGHAEAGLPRAGRQVGQPLPRRRRPRQRRRPWRSFACMHGGQGCAIPTRLLVPRSRYDEAVEIVKAGVRGLELRRPHRPVDLQGPQVSKRQQERVLGYIEKGKAEGARLVTGGGVPKHLDEGLLRRAHAVRRRRQLDDHRPGGDLRPGARR